MFVRRARQGFGVSERLARLSVPECLELAGLLVFAAVYLLLAEYGRPGLGISQGFYLAIVLVALASGPVTGALAGVGAAALCALAGLTAEHVSWPKLEEPLAIRLAAFTAAGVTVGFFARRGRRMLAESLHVLDELLSLAKRDIATGVFTPDGISARIARRADRSWPFAVLVGDVDAQSDAVLRDALRTLAAELAGDGELARVGPSRVMAVTSSLSLADAEEQARALESVLDGATFGWAFHPHDGGDVLALFGAASERLHARRAIAAVGE